MLVTEDHVFANSPTPGLVLPPVFGHWSVAVQPCYLRLQPRAPAQDRGADETLGLGLKGVLLSQDPVKSSLLAFTWASTVSSALSLGSGVGSSTFWLVVLLGRVQQVLLHLPKPSLIHRRLSVSVSKAQSGEAGGPPLCLGDRD